MSRQGAGTSVPAPLACPAAVHRHRGLPLRSSGAFCSRPVAPGVLLCWLARSLPRVRYKILPARLLGGENGTKLSLHAESAPNRAISGVLGEFCTGSGPAGLVLGEFCLASGPDGLASGDLCPNLASPVSPARSYESPNGAIHSNAACRSARGRGPGRFQQQISSDNYLNNFKAFGPIMNGAKIIDEPSPTPKPPITSVTQWTPRYRRVTQMKTMNTRAAAHSR